MTRLKRWSALSAAAATVCLASVICLGAGLAGAQPNGAMKRSLPEASPDATALKPGTYHWFIDGVDGGIITFASNNTYTSTLDGGDSGTWVQAGETAGLSITGGNDVDGVCVFAGHVIHNGKAMSFAAKPGDWSCPGVGSSGTFYIKKGGAAAGGYSAALAHAVVRPRTAGHIVPGTYTWTSTGGVSGSMSIASGNTYAITMSVYDSGTWAQGGSAFAFSISDGTDEQGGCLEVGKVDTTGTSVGTTAKPGNWVCPAFRTHGFFVIS
jgi:hypothetical protein